MDLLADLLELGALGLDVVPLPAADQTWRTGRVRVGISETAREDVDPQSFDLLLCAQPDAPRPWVGGDVDAMVEILRGRFAAAPTAFAVAAQVLRLGEGLTLEAALTLESLAYSLLLTGGAFRSWRAANPARARTDLAASRLSLERSPRGLEARLTRPGRRNAVDAAMRDALVEAFAFALEDPDRATLFLTAEGPDFSAGGDLDEFGSAQDLALAHILRVERSAAAYAARLGDRLVVEAHGACIGAGIEIPAAAGKLLARAGAVFQLPEVGMGVIPGAGGTATLARRIGRHRTAWMALSAERVDLDRALAWGLVDGRL